MTAQERAQKILDRCESHPLTLHKNNPLRVLHELLNEEKGPTSELVAYNFVLEKFRSTLNLLKAADSMEKVDTICSDALNSLKMYG